MTDPHNITLQHIYIYYGTHPINQRIEEATAWTPNLPSIHIRITSTGCETLATTSKRLVFFTWPLPIQDTSHVTNSSASPTKPRAVLFIGLPPNYSLSIMPK